MTGRIEAAVQSRIENEANLKRMTEIREIIERIDFRWDHGFMGREEYLENRQQLQAEVEALRPIDYEALQEAADLLQNFRGYWDKCAEQPEPAQARDQLLDKIIYRVFVYGEHVLAVVLHGNFAVLLDKKQIAPSEMIDALVVELQNEGIVDIVRSRCGSDGVRTRDLRLDRPTC